MGSSNDAESDVKLFSTSESSPTPAEHVAQDTDLTRDDKSLPSLLDTECVEGSGYERPRRGCASSVQSAELASIDVSSLRARDLDAGRQSRVLKSKIMAVCTTQKIPKKVSEFIVDFYLENSHVLLRNTSSRNVTLNSEREQLYETLARRIETDFGLVFDRKKIKTHFEHFKSRTLAKGAKMIAGINRQTSSSREGAPEELRAVNPRAVAFDMSEFKLWSYLNDSPVTVGEQLAGCSVVLQPCTSLSTPAAEQGEQAHVGGGVTGNQEAEAFDEMAGSPTSSGSTDSAVDVSRARTNDCDVVGDLSSSAQNRKKRKYEELLDEQILMYREQRRFFTEMANAQMQMSAMVGSLHDVVKAVMHRLVGSDVEPPRGKERVAANAVCSTREGSERSTEIQKSATAASVKEEDLGCTSDRRNTNKIYRAKRVEHKGYHVAKHIVSRSRMCETGDAPPTVLACLTTRR